MAINEIEQENRYLSLLILFGFIILKMIIQYQVIAPGYELHRDEFLHLDQAHHLAWGFLSIPPVTSWTSLLIYWLGNSVFWVKFFPALYGALTIVLVWKISEVLKGKLFACILGATACLLSSYLRINTLYQPNSLDILCWTFLFYCLIQYISSERNKWIYWFAVGFAIGFLNKYNIAFLVIALIPALLLTKYRNIFTKKATFSAALLALIIILPNLIWQINNGLPVIKHMQELTDLQLVNIERSAFLKEQLLFFAPSFFILIIAFVGLISYKPFKDYRFVLYTYIFTIFFFLIFHGKPYYALGLYPVLISFGAVYTAYLTELKRTRLLRPVIFLVILGISIFYIPAICPVYSPERIQNDPEILEMYRKTGQLHWEDGKEHHIPQDYADMVGWKELTDITLSAWNSFNEKQREKTLILCNEYGHAGAINYYSNRLLDAASISADYRDWFPGKEKIIDNIIMVIGNIPDNAHLYFDDIYKFGDIKNPLSREYGTSVFILKNAHEPMNGQSLKELLLN
ncbi:hypothetical protein GGR21_003695 [Dysgonomonas hofstadii]|uniref:Glycosyltransferase RgtA/B/C/D-like domain-containing protein n=1 Tax=Dysgonomonas hofstadii TaxID=637886 RepID=A0A840CVV0_9BACT|nr:glycosyltransferase family 39 protein [Dysgonomonas hofstadii]MBB4037774.1 hypothetical protein [Dysgonomonas hofstadii]